MSIQFNFVTVEVFRIAQTINEMLQFIKSMWSVKFVSMLC